MSFAWVRALVLVPALVLAGRVAAQDHRSAKKDSGPRV